MGYNEAQDQFRAYCFKGLAASDSFLLDFSFLEALNYKEVTLVEGPGKKSIGRNLTGR